MKYLYQYTNKESLKSILKNKTIRLRPLSSMDDMEEGLSADSKAIGDYVFVSCWSEVPEEMIPMWYMYGDKYQGVRIGLPANPFVQYTYTEEDKKNYGINWKNNNLTTVIPLEDFQNMERIFYPVNSEQCLNKVKYTDDPELLSPALWAFQSNGRYDFLFGKMGQYKNTYWGFQKEYRYKISILPMDGLSTVSTDLSRTLWQRMNEISEGKISLPCDYYDLRIDPNMLERMEIIIGPLMSNEEEEEIRTFVKTISERIIIKRSSLFGRIRV